MELTEEERRKLHSEFLLEEYRLVEEGIWRLGEATAHVRQWCVTTWAAVLGWFLSRRDQGDLALGLLLAAGVVIGFWVLEMLLRELLRPWHHRSNKIEWFINAEYAGLIPTSHKPFATPWISHTIRPERAIKGPPTPPKPPPLSWRDLPGQAEHLISLFFGRPRVWFIYWALLKLTGIVYLLAGKEVLPLLIGAALFCFLLQVLLCIASWRGKPRCPECGWFAGIIVIVLIVALVLCLLGWLDDTLSFLQSLSKTRWFGLISFAVLMGFTALQLSRGTNVVGADEQRCPKKTGGKPALSGEKCR